MTTTMESIFSAFTDPADASTPAVLHSEGDCETCPPDDGDETGRRSKPRKPRKPLKPFPGDRPRAKKRGRGRR